MTDVEDGFPCETVSLIKCERFIDAIAHPGKTRRKPSTSQLVVWPIDAVSRISRGIARQFGSYEATPKLPQRDPLPAHSREQRVGHWALHGHSTNLKETTGLEFQKLFSAANFYFTTWF